MKSSRFGLSKRRSTLLLVFLGTLCAVYKFTPKRRIVVGTFFCRRNAQIIVRNVSSNSHKRPSGRARATRGFNSTITYDGDSTYIPTKRLVGVPNGTATEKKVVMVSANRLQVMVRVVYERLLSSAHLFEQIFDI